MKKRKFAAGLLSAVVMLTAGFAFQTDVHYGRGLMIAPEAAVAAEIETDTGLMTETFTEEAVEMETEAGTELPTEETEEAVTEVHTEVITEAATETVTEAASEPITEAVTEAATEAVNEPFTEATSEPITETVTEAVTEVKTDTEAPAEAVTEIVTETVTEEAEENSTEVLITEKFEAKQVQSSKERASQAKGKAVTVFQEGMEWPSGYEHYFNSYAQSSQRIGFGSDVYPEGFSAFYSASLEEESSQGNIGVRYNKVGKYQGQDIDMEVIATDWGETSDMKVGGTYVSVASFNKGDVVKPTVAFSKKRPRMFVSGTEYIDFTFRFYVSGTNTPVSVKGHSTAVDLDAKQGVKFFGGVESAYVSADSALLIDSWNKVYSENSGNVNSDDQSCWVSFNFSSESHRVRFYCGSYWDRLSHDDATEDYGYATSFDIIEFSPRLVTDIKKNFHIRVVKKDSETKNALAGAVFQLYQWSMEKNQYVAVGNLTDQQDGTYELQNVFYSDDNQGMFCIKEEQAPLGYNRSDWEQEFTTDGVENGHTFTYTVENTPVKTAVQIHKTDRDSKKNLKGAVYGVYLDEACTKKVTETAATDSSGNGATPMFRKGQETYYVKEIQAPEGYFLDETVFSVKAGDNTVVTVERTDQKALGKVAIAKAADRTKNVEFREETGRYEGEKKSGSYGPGEWVTFSICVTNTGNTTVKNLKVTEKPGEYLQKIWEEGTAAYVLPGEWKTQKGAAITGRVDENDPWILYLDVLAPGDSVNFQFQCRVKEQLKEVEGRLENQISVSGQYILPNGSGTAAIVPDEDDTDSDEILAVIPDISVTKLADRTAGVELVNGRYQGEKEIGWYQFGETVKYEIRVNNIGNVPAVDILVEEQLGEALSEAMVPDSAAYVELGELISEKGNPVQVITEEMNPLNIRLDRLEAGDSIVLQLTLKLRERGIEKLEELPNTVVVSGKYEIPDQEKIPDIPEDEEDWDIDWISVHGGKLTVYKRDRENGALLQDAEFEVQTLEGEVLEILITNQEGTDETTYLPLGTYTLVETRAPEGYELEIEPHEFTFTEQEKEIVLTVENDRPEPETPKETETESETEQVRTTEPETEPETEKVKTTESETELQTEKVPETAPVSKAAETASSVKTGDHTNMLLWFTVMVFSGGILAVGVFRKVKKSEKKEKE